MGVQSAWLVVPPLRTLYVFYPTADTQTFIAGNLRDEVTKVEIALPKIFN